MPEHEYSCGSTPDSGTRPVLQVPSCMRQDKGRHSESMCAVGYDAGLQPVNSSTLPSVLTLLSPMMSTPSSLSSTVYNGMEFGKCEEPTLYEGSPLINHAIAKLQFVTDLEGGVSLNQRGPTFSAPLALVPGTLKPSPFDSTKAGMKPCGNNIVPACGKKHFVWMALRTFNWRKRNSNDSARKEREEAEKNDARAGNAMKEAVREALEVSKRRASALPCDPTCPKVLEIGYTWVKAFILFDSPGETYIVGHAWAFGQYGINCVPKWFTVPPSPGDPIPPANGGGTPTPPDNGPERSAEEPRSSRAVADPVFPGERAARAVTG